MLSIDPGNSTTGVAMWEIDAYTGTIISVSAQTLHAVRLRDTSGLDPDLYPERTIKLYRMTSAMEMILSDVRPSIVACEACFMHRAFPMAYGSLLTISNAYRDALIRHNPNVPFYTVEPLLVKKMIGATSMKDKDAVTTAVSRVPEIMSALRTDLSTLDEHAVDAIAIGYAHLKISSP